MLAHGATVLCGRVLPVVGARDASSVIANSIAQKDQPSQTGPSNSKVDSQELAKNQQKNPFCQTNHLSFYLAKSIKGTSKHQPNAEHILTNLPRVVHQVVNCKMFQMMATRVEMLKCFFFAFVLHCFIPVKSPVRCLGQSCHVFFSQDPLSVGQQCQQHHGSKRVTGPGTDSFAGFKGCQPVNLLLLVL